MTNQTVPVVTPAKILRNSMLVPNGRETDGSVHYDELRPVTDADLVWFVDYLKSPEVAAIVGTDTVQQAIEKLDRKDDYIENKVSTAQNTANMAQSAANTAQSTANTATSRANNALDRAEEALEIVAYEWGGSRFYVKFKNAIVLQGGYGGNLNPNSWNTLSFGINFLDENNYVVMVTNALSDPASVTVENISGSSFKVKGIEYFQYLAFGRGG